MNETILLISAFTLGAALGTFFFGGLWWTVHKLAIAKAPQAWLLGSFIVRIAAVLPVFYFCVREGLGAALASVAGFVAMRILITRWLRERKPEQVQAVIAA